MLHHGSALLVVLIIFTQQTSEAPCRCTECTSCNHAQHCQPEPICQPRVCHQTPPCEPIVLPRSCKPCILRPFPRPVPVDHPIPVPVAKPFPVLVPQLNQCCSTCRVTCSTRKIRHKRENIKTVAVASKERRTYDDNQDAVCNNEQLRMIMQNNTIDNPDVAKDVIQTAAELALHAKLNVFCARGQVAYGAYAELYCQQATAGIVCYAFKST